MHLADLQSYLDADGRLLELYAHPHEWARKAILNIASSGKFSSDRTITQYAAEIWNVSSMSGALAGKVQEVSRQVGPSSASIGQSAPIGATVSNGGVNFSLYSRDASKIELLLFDRDHDPLPARVITLDPSLHRDYHYWHVFVPGLQPGQIYAYRVHGPHDPAQGSALRCNQSAARSLRARRRVPQNYCRESARGIGDNAASAMKKRRRRSAIV